MAQTNHRNVSEKPRFMLNGLPGLLQVRN